MHTELYLTFYSFSVQETLYFFPKSFLFTRTHTADCCKVHFHLQETNIYIRNLSYRTEDDLKDQFSQFGKIISVKILRRDGTSRNVGFVRFQTPLEAETAILQMDGKTVEGRKMQVELARSKEN